MPTQLDIAPSDRLMMALIFAGIVHTFVIFGISFDLPKAKKSNKSLAITLVDSRSEKAPEKADFLVQQNQIGSGEQQQKVKPPAKIIEQLGTSHQIKENTEQKQERAEIKTKKKLLAQQQAKRKVLSQKPDNNTSEHQMSKITAAKLSQQIAQLGSEMSVAYENYAKRPKMMYINSINAHKYKAASYERTWQDKVERVGKLNYPHEARQKNFSGALLLSVGINRDGTIYSLKVHRSSGHKVLDDAAVRIVRLAGPYAPFPQALAEEAEILVITRTWKFFDNDRMITSR